MAIDDYGGELDPHGADLVGLFFALENFSNVSFSVVILLAVSCTRTHLLAVTTPMGRFTTGQSAFYFYCKFRQILTHVSFMGGHTFCIKLCDPNGKNPGGYCQNIYDRLGCAYNAPNNAKNGTFEVCDGEDMTPPGLYTGSSGATQTYFQPPESLGPITSVPYTPVVPASSNCVTYHSTNLYTALPTPTGGAATTGKSTGATQSASAGAAASTSNGASAIGISSVATIAGVVFAMVFLS